MKKQLQKRRVVSASLRPGQYPQDVATLLLGLEKSNYPT